MKILIVSQYFFPENFRVNDLAIRLQKRGHKVTVLTGIPNYPEGRAFGKYKLLSQQWVSNISVYRVPIITRGKGNKFRLIINYLSFVISALFLGPFLLRKERPDLVLSVNYSPATVGLVGTLISKLKGVPCALWVQDIWPESLKAVQAVNNKIILNYIDKLMNWIYRNNQVIFVQANSFIKIIASKEPLASKKLVFMPNWAEELFNQEPNQMSFNAGDLLPKNKTIIVFAGNLGYAQALDTIVEAAEKTRKQRIQWVIVGDGRYKRDLERLVSDRNLKNNVSILGKFPLEYMPSFFKAADILLVTLKKDKIFGMTIPGKIQSYLLSSKPILSSVDGEGQAIVRDSGAGMAVEAEDSQALADAAVLMSSLSKSELNKMGTKGYFYYQKHFNPELVISNFEKSCIQVIKSSSKQL